MDTTERLSLSLFNACFTSQKHSMSSKNPQESLTMVVQLCAQGEGKMELVNNEPICPYTICDHLGYPCCSVTQSCPTVCDPMDCSMLGFPVLHHLPEFAQTHVQLKLESVMPSNHLILCCPLLFLPSISKDSASVSFPVSQLSASGGQSIVAAASASVLPVNIQG